ncbi:MAG: YbaN family protein [Clostridiales Family XIII bacterium]|jgi:uncharacterized membrane protein YbaN (DUF454 family)|nr:YbaN family protein [Clostridiales Family XIII bacterium]
MKYVYIVCGIISLGLGAVGAVLPLLPSVPFFLLALFCFARGSKKLHDWFMSTKLYEKHLDGFVRKRAMPRKTKACILCSVTALMAIGFIMMKEVPIGRATLAIIWALHVYYFLFRVKTEQRKPDSSHCEQGEAIQRK